ncbi:MAG: RidA family protein [Sporomusaceae bacterium]|nr:RidA family protein [Sporomusaceae bacterium]
MTTATPAPVPQGNYVAATRHGELVYTAGMTPRRQGRLMFSGKVSAAAVDAYGDAVRLAAANALTAARSLLTGDENVLKILSLTVFIASEDGFQAHSQLADFASDYLRQEIGAGGVGSRAAVGVASLPGNAPVEIQLIAVVG